MYFGDKTEKPARNRENSWVRQLSRATPFPNNTLLGNRTVQSIALTTNINRFTRYQDIERWWKIVCSAYLLVSLPSESLSSFPPDAPSPLASHLGWDPAKGWKNILNNLCLVIQPFVLFHLIYPWLTVFPIPELSWGFSQLQSIVDRLTSPIFIFLTHPDFYFSSA